MAPRVPVTIEARLGYRNKGDPEDQWKEYASSTETRTMDCTPPEVSIFTHMHFIGFKFNSCLLPFYSAERRLSLLLFTASSFRAWSASS